MSCIPYVTCIVFENNLFNGDSPLIVESQISIFRYNASKYVIVEDVSHAAGKAYVLIIASVKRRILTKAHGPFDAEIQGSIFSSNRVSGE